MLHFMSRLLLFFCLLFSIPAFAQEPKGTVSGKITDEQGKPVSEADIFIYNGKEIIGSAISGADGRYLTNRMYTGTYSVQVIYGEYKHSWVNHVPVKEWQDTRVNVQLEVKDANPSIDVNREYSGGSVLQSTKK
jgi:hypothetical protein